MRDEVAIFRAAGAGPVFGNGDIYICSDSDKKAESYSNLGAGYNCGDLKDNATFLANETKFMCEDIEVYRVSTTQ